jgi:hypothetical protein
MPYYRIFLSPNFYLSLWQYAVNRQREMPARNASDKRQREKNFFAIAQNHASPSRGSKKIKKTGGGLFLCKNEWGLG